MNIAYFDDVESAKAAMKEEYEETIQAYRQFKSIEKRIDENTAWINSGQRRTSYKCLTLLLVRVLKCRL